VQQTQEFARLVEKCFPGSRLRRAWPLAGGISAGMTALEIEAPDGRLRQVIVRRPGAATLARRPQAAAEEFRLLQMTRRLGLATPEVYLLDESGEILAGPYLVMEYVEGRMAFAPANPADYVAQMAGELARIHGVACAGEALAFLAKGGAGIGGRPARVDESLAEERIRDALEGVWPLAPRNEAVLLHGDYWPGNVLWRDGRLVAVIDWEDACCGDPLMDLAIARLDIGWIFGLEAMQTFTGRYQSLMAIDYSHLPYWDLWAALRLVRLMAGDVKGWAAFFEPFGRGDITEETIRRDYGVFVRRAFEKLHV
jgi:aminoglycoside phosphotransferase (APT) family kinase protein